MTLIESLIKNEKTECKAREKRMKEWNKFTGTKVRVGTAKIAIGSIMDIAIKAKNEEEFNHIIELMGRLL